MKPAVKAFINDYLAEMLEGGVAFFAGAGLSMPAGFVDWRNLLRPLSAELELSIDLESDLVAVAQFHVNANGANRHKIHSAIVDALSPNKPPTKNHELLARLPIRTWWTTNYDKLMENALRDAGKVVDIKTAVPQLAITRPGRDATLYKMHGDVDRPDEAVVTRDDYERYPRDRGAFTNALSGDLVSKTFLFLGFSFTDPNLQHVLSTIRLTFQKNQRRHYAVFKTRSKEEDESDASFEHHKARQRHVIEDLKLYNVRVILIDEYSEITEMLTELSNRYRRRTVFVSGSAADFSPWGDAAVSRFTQKLGQRLVATGSKIATGLGVGIGDAVFTGALRDIRRTRSSIEETLVLRPFPQGFDPAEREAVWKDYRSELISHAGISLFVFGNKQGPNGFELAEGVLREFEIAHELGVVLLPVGATGSAAAELSRRVISDFDTYGKELGAKARVYLKDLDSPTGDLESIIDKITDLVAIVQERGD